jgi:cell division protease FtsH
MSDALGPMVYGENEGEVFLGRSVTTHQNMSEETMKTVDKEVRAIIDEQYALARRLLEENRDKVEVDDQGAARVGDHRLAPDRRHHERPPAASAEAGGGEADDAAPGDGGTRGTEPAALRSENT